MNAEPPLLCRTKLPPPESSFKSQTSGSNAHPYLGPSRDCIPPVIKMARGSRPAFLASDRDHTIAHRHHVITIK